MFNQTASACSQPFFGMSQRSITPKINAPLTLIPKQNRENQFRGSQFSWSEGVLRRWNTPLMSLINELVLRKCCVSCWHIKNKGCTAGGEGPPFSSGPRPQLAKSPISVWLVRVIMYYVSEKLLIHLHHGSTSGAGESIYLRGFGIFPTATTLHQESQIKGVWWLLFVNTCTPWEVGRGVNGL